MTPLAFINGVLLGTCASIAFGLLVVMLLFAMLGSDTPQVVPEWPALWRSTAIFLVMTVFCGLSFISLVKNRPWRWPAQALMWLGVAGTVVYYFGP